MQLVKPGRRAGFMLALGCLAGVPAAHALEITLPPETARYTPSELPGYRLVQQNCMTCHSAQYVQTQPPSSPRGYWDATVKKMKKPFGAPFPDEDIPAMVDYLSKTYGAERTAYAGTAAPQGAGAAAPAAVATAGSHDPLALMAANNCSACHAVDKKIVGPAFRDVAAKYANQPGAAALVAQNIAAGGAGKWGQVPMPPYPGLAKEDLQSLAQWILGR
ncbi:c-type cytochrome [Cupriavidus sp. 2TAF22]|uniref:SorB family sulfite dehydrogenase c-type cytochrome subunit n=1 Tax=unclassified Cupriavidus TaxID=2640874 RepID=UPI003F937544